MSKFPAKNGLKICFACREELPVSLFNKLHTKKDGLNPSCRICVNKRKAIYREENREEIRRVHRERRYDLKDPKRKENIWKQNNSEKGKARYKKWVSENRDRVNAYSRNRSLSNRLAFNIRASVSKYVKNKWFKTFDVIELSIEELINHLESKFTDGMSWDNYGLRGWHIDHIRPLSSFNLQDTEELKKAWSLDNLQPLWAIDNIKKSNKILN